MAAIADTAGMGEEDEWRERLRGAVEATRRSMRDLSIASGLAHGYLHSVLKVGKDPSIESLLKLTRVLGQPIVTLFEEPHKTEARRRLQRIAGRLTPEQIELLEGLADTMLGKASAPPPEKESPPDKP